MRIALDAMGGDHAAGPLWSRVPCRPSPPIPNLLRDALVGDQSSRWNRTRRPGESGGPHAASTSSSLHPSRSAWRRARSSALRQQARQLHQPVLAACSPRTKSKPSSAQATPAPWWLAWLRLRRFLKGVRPARHRGGPCRRPKGRLRPARRREPTSIPKPSSPLPIRRDGQHFRHAMILPTRHANHRPAQRRLRGSSRGTTWPRTRTPCSTPARSRRHIHRQRRGPRHSTKACAMSS